MKIPLISKIPVHSIAWSVLAGVIAGLLLVGGQYFLRDVERREQKLETKRYVDELERIVSRNPIRVVGLQAPDEMPEVRPTTKVVDNTRETVRTPIWVNSGPGRARRILDFLRGCTGLYVGQEADCRRFVEAVLWINRSGAQWRLPGRIRELEQRLQTIRPLD